MMQIVNRAIILASAPTVAAVRAVRCDDQKGCIGIKRTALQDLEDNFPRVKAYHKKLIARCAPFRKGTHPETVTAGDRAKTLVAMKPHPSIQ